MTREECCAVVSEKEMPMTVYDMVAAMQEKFASRPAFRWVDDATITVKEKTYGEFVADIRKMTGYLQETVADLKGQRIAILSRTNYEYGVVAFGSSLDQVGPFARSVEDAALALNALSGRDELDCTSQPCDVDFTANLAEGARGMKIVIVRAPKLLAGFLRRMFGI